MTSRSMLYGGVEAGGTKFVCAVGTGPDDLRDVRRLATTDPDTTLEEVIATFRDAIVQHGPLSAIGIASFGPLDLRPGSPTWGRITTTPKLGWSDTDLVTPLRQAFGVPIGFDTDVNGAALAEARWGAAQELDSLVYITVGTGVGGGAVLHGRPVHGLVHPEIGHLLVPRHPDDPFPGVCPFHGACIEGLASGSAIAARWGRSGESLPPDHAAWELEAAYLGDLAANLTLTLSPQRLIFGGGVLATPGLLAKIRRQLVERLGGYVRSPALDDASDYLVAPGLGDRAGVLGAIELARQAAARA